MDLTIGSSFGSVSGVITSLGLILGMYGANMKSRPIVISLISIALSDSISDALGIYYGVKTQNKQNGAIQEALYALTSKFLIPIFMILPFVLLDTTKGVLINLVVGFSIIIYMSNEIFVEKRQKIQNILISWLAVILTYLVGKTFT